MPECKKCGECCRYVIMENVFADKKLEEYFAAREWVYEKNARMLYIPQVCPHLKDNQCDIYENRPEFCKLYPTRTDKKKVPHGCAFEQIIRRR